MSNKCSLCKDKLIFVTSTEEPVIGPVDSSTGYHIQVRPKCPYGNKCNRKREWIQEYDQYEIHAISKGELPPDVHYHICYGAKWHVGTTE